MFIHHWEAKNSVLLQIMKVCWQTTLHTNYIVSVMILSLPLKAFKLQNELHLKQNITREML